MSSSGVENMFDLYRFRNQQDSHKILLYFPFGFLFLLLRLTVASLVLPFLIFFPMTSRQRRFILKGICLLFGVKVKLYLQDRDENAKLLICNHTSILDHIIVESIFPCKQVNVCSHFNDWTFPALFSYNGRHNPNEVFNTQMNFLQQCFDTNTCVCIFPEKTTTNGRHGLLKFDPLPFSTAFPIQPIAVHISHTSFISISPSVIGSSSWCDLMWLLFIPCSTFTLRALPSMVKESDESTECFSRRVQVAMASSLGVLATEFTERDKVDYQKQVAAGTIRLSLITHSSSEQLQGSDISKMAIQVREILPDVPNAVILHDLGITKSVDDTILRILEGKVIFIPENVSFSHGLSEKQSSSSEGGPRSRCSIRKQVQPLNTAAKDFGKTPKDRMMSYQERKAALLRSAKLQYFRKHGLNS